MNYKKILSSFLISVLLVNNCWLVVTPAQAESLADGQESIVTLSFSPTYEERGLPPSLKLGRAGKSATTMGGSDDESQVKKYYPLLESLTLLKTKTNPSSLSINYYLYSDHLSSTSIVYTDQGEVVESHRYSPYGDSMPTNSSTSEEWIRQAHHTVRGAPLASGNTVPKAGSDNPMGSFVASASQDDGKKKTEDDDNITDHLYTNQTKDTSTDLYYYHARYYDPTTARFIQPDTAVGGNRYQYVGNNPVNFTDPNGHMHEPWGGVGGGVDADSDRGSTAENNVLFFPLALNGASVDQYSSQGSWYLTQAELIAQYEEAELSSFGDSWRSFFLASLKHQFLFPETNKLCGLSLIRAFTGKDLTLHERIGDLIHAGSATMDIIAQTYTAIMTTYMYADFARGLIPWAEMYYYNYRAKAVQLWSSPMPQMMTAAAGGESLSNKDQLLAQVNELRSNDETAAVIAQNLIELRYDYQDAFPSTIVHFGPFKVRKAWFANVAAYAELLETFGYVDDPSISQAIADFHGLVIDPEFTKRLTTAGDIKIGNDFLDLILKFFLGN